MTNKDIRRLIKLIKDSELYCKVWLEADETGLSEDDICYSEIRVRAYRDEHHIHDIFQLQIISDSDGETYFLENESCQHGEDVVRQANGAIKYCKHLIKKYM